MCGGFGAFYFRTEIKQKKQTKKTEDYSCKTLYKLPSN